MLVIGRMSTPGRCMSMITQVMPLCLPDVRVGAHEQFAVVAVLAVARPDLGAGDDELVAVDDAARSAATARSDPALRLGEALAPRRLAPQDARQVERLLLLAAAHDQRSGRRARRRPRRRPVPGAPRADQLLVPDDLLEQREAAAAVFRSPVDAGPAAFELRSLPGLVELAQFGPGVCGRGSRGTFSSSQVRASSRKSFSSGSTCSSIAVHVPSCLAGDGDLRQAGSNCRMVQSVGGVVVGDLDGLADREPFRGRRLAAGRSSGSPSSIVHVHDRVRARLPDRRASAPAARRCRCRSHRCRRSVSRSSRSSGTRLQISFGT